MIRLAGTQVRSRNAVPLVIEPGRFGRFAAGEGGAGEVDRPPLLPTAYPSPSGGSMCGPCSVMNASNSSGVISRAPARDWTSFQEGSAPASVRRRSNSSKAGPLKLFVRIR